LLGLYNFPKILHFSLTEPIPSCDSCKITAENLSVVFPNIGAIKLDKNQRNYWFDYFNLLLMPWAYIPAEDRLRLLESFFEKRYGDRYADIFKKAAKLHKEIRENDPRILEGLRPWWHKLFF
jgi:hypothetical protein